MKKLITAITLMLGMTIISCGPSAEELKSQAEALRIEAENKINVDSFFDVRYKEKSYADTVDISVIISSDKAEDASWLGTTVGQTKEIVEDIVRIGKYDIAKHVKTFRASSIMIMDLDDSDFFREALVSENEIRVSMGDKPLSAPTPLSGWCQVNLMGEASNSYGVPADISGFFAFDYVNYVKELNQEGYASLDDYLFRYL